MDIFEAGLRCAHTLSSQNAWPLRAPHPLPGFCSVATETTNIPPFVHSELETGQLRRISVASKIIQQACWRWFMFFQVSVGTEVENWPLETPLAELTEFRKRKERKRKKETQDNCSKKFPSGYIPIRCHSI